MGSPDEFVTYEHLLHEAVEALDGMRASVRWDERSPLHMNDEWLARTVLDRIWPLIEASVTASSTPGDDHEGGP